MLSEIGGCEGAQLTTSKHSGSSTDPARTILQKVERVFLHRGCNKTSTLSMKILSIRRGVTLNWYGFFFFKYLPEWRHLKARLFADYLMSLFWSHCPKGLLAFWVSHLEMRGFQGSYSYTGVTLYFSMETWPCFLPLYFCSSTCCLLIFVNLFLICQFGFPVDI